MVEDSKASMHRYLLFPLRICIHKHLKLIEVDKMEEGVVARKTGRNAGCKMFNLDGRSVFK